MYLWLGNSQGVVVVVQLSVLFCALRNNLRKFSQFLRIINLFEEVFPNVI